MQVTTNIQIDFTLPGFPETVHAMQQDEATRYVTIDMTSGGQPFTPPSGTSGVLAILKPDGTTCYYDAVGGTPAVVLSGSTATCLLVPEALTAAGEAKAALVLYNADGSRLTTFRFRLVVDETPVPDGVIESSSYYSILTQQIAQALTAAEVAKQVLDMTVSAETLAAGSQATVTKTTSGGVVNLAFGIPQGIQGEQGEQGDAATVAVGTVTTLAPGQSATVTNGGTDSAAILNFGIPKGDSGADMIASPYDSESTYFSGQYVVQSGALYVAKQDITEPEPFTQSHWNQITVGESLTQLIGEISPSLVALWQNAAPTASFSGQQIPLAALSEYTLFYATFVSDSQNENAAFWAMVSNGQSIYVPCGVFYNNGTTWRQCYRSMIVNKAANILQYGDASNGVNGSVAVDNTVMVPLAFYGFKNQ